MKNNKGISVIGILVVIGIVFGLTFILWNIFGRGKGNGKGNGESKNEKTTQMETELTVSPTITEDVKEAFYVDVIVKGDKYSYNGGEYQLESIVEELLKVKKNYHEEDKSLKVRISEDQGLKKTFDSLVTKLEENGLEYIDNTGE